MRDRRTALLRAGAAGLAAVIAGGAAAADGKLPEGWAIDISAEVRLRGEARSDNDFDRALDDERREGLQRTRFGVQVEKKGEARVLVQIQDSRVGGSEATTATDTHNVDLHQGYVEVQALGVKGLSLCAGRREWKYGDERIIGAFGWDNVGRAFDGGTLRWQRSKFWVDGFYAQVAQRSNTVDAGIGTRGSSLAGAYGHWSPRQGDEWEAYGMTFHDSDRRAGEAGESGQRRVNMAGGRARSRVGRLDYVAEAAIQRGDFDGNEHRAWAAAGQAGLVLGEDKRWRAFAGYDFATGDRRNTDGVHEEFFNFFPTNHPHYGTMDLFGWRNLRSPYAGASLAWGRHWVQAKVHAFGLQQAAGRWTNAAGDELELDAAGASGRRVGREADLTYRFRWTDHLSLEADVSRFEPGRFAEAQRGRDPSHFAYLMLTFGL